MRSILVAYDFSEASREAVAWARTLRARLHAGLTIVHVDADEPALGALRRAETQDVLRRRQRMLETELVREVAELLGPDETAVRALVVRGRPADAVIELATELGADLVVAGASGKSRVERVLLGSTTLELVRRCPVPVLTIP